MDIDRARTFLEIAHTGSFLKASERLHVTQTTVSARVRTLEEALGRRLFVRTRNGAALTAAGREFERFAQSFVQVWERARQQLAADLGVSKRVRFAGLTLKGVARGQHRALTEEEVSSLYRLAGSTR